MRCLITRKIACQAEPDPAPPAAKKPKLVHISELLMIADVMSANSRPFLGARMAHRRRCSPGAWCLLPRSGCLQDLSDLSVIRLTRPVRPRQGPSLRSKERVSALSLLAPKPQISYEADHCLRMLRGPLQGAHVAFGRLPCCFCCSDCVAIADVQCRRCCERSGRDAALTCTATQFLLHSLHWANGSC